jgi:hypothetical protein
LYLTASSISKGRRHSMRQEVDITYTLDAPEAKLKLNTWRRHVIQEVGSHVLFPSLTAQKSYKGTASRSWIGRQETLAAARWRRQPLKGDAVTNVNLYIIFDFSFIKGGLLVGNFRVRTLVDFCSNFRVPNPLFFHVQLNISYPLIIQYVYVLFDYIVCFSFF